MPQVSQPDRKAMALLILNLDFRWRWVVKPTTQSLFVQEIIQVHAIVWAPGTV